MHINCGTDIIEIGRIKELIESSGEKFLERVFTPNEIQYCESKGKMKFQHYAARFAAKEAVFKAVSRFLDNKYDIGWRNIEISNNETGKPSVNFVDIQLNEALEIDISVSHCKEYATACAVVCCN